MPHNIPNICLLLLTSTICLNLINASVNISATHSKFADGLTALMYKDGQNECSSSLGISMAFSLIYPGSSGESTEQIRDVLGYPSFEGSSSPIDQPLVWQETTDRLANSYNGECTYEVQPGFKCHEEKPILQVAYSIWIDNEFILASKYQNAVGNYVRQLDFKDENSPVIINDWVSNSTNGLIDSIIEENQPISYALIAINTIYLKASWSSTFDTMYTNVDTFYTSPSRDNVVGQAHFMHQKFRNLMYSQDALPGFQVVQLPFESSALSMILVLPIAENTAAATSFDVLATLPKLESKPVVLALPKFKFESSYDDNLKEALKTLGMTAPFDASGLRGGDLCNITGRCDLFVEKIIQKTVIDLNEDGVEAAAVTAIMVGYTAVLIQEPPEYSVFMADHPFQFFLYDENEDLVFFEGQVGDPGMPAESDTPQLTFAHNDSNFWSNTFGVDNVVKPFLPPLVSDTDSIVDPTTVENISPERDPSDTESVIDTTSDLNTIKTEGDLVGAVGTETDTTPAVEADDTETTRPTTITPTSSSDTKTDDPASITDDLSTGCSSCLYVFAIINLSLAMSLLLL